MPNPRNPAPVSLSYNLRSARSICRTPACKAPTRNTQSERAARKASETKDADRCTARADKANKHRKQAERFVEEVGEVITRKRVVAA
jgi:hypothetical protein